jgi:hypothetical protein
LKAFLSFPFKDEKWASKLGIAVLLTFLGFLVFPLFILMGYIYEIMRRIIVDRESPSMPEWDDWNEYLANGFKMWGAAMIYSIPGLAFFIPYMLMTFGLPLLSNSGADLDPVMGIVMILMFLLMGLGFLFSMLGWVILAPGWGHMVARGEFAAAFRIREFWPVLRYNLVGYLLTFIIYMGLLYTLGFASQLLVFTIVLCVFSPLVMLASSVYLYLVIGALFARAYVDGAENAAAKEATLAPAAE